MSDLESRLGSALNASYRIERELGQGGMATVFLAHDLKHDRDVAIKVMRPEIAQSLGAERFVREIGLTARLSHPHILPLLDSGAVPDADGGALLYYVMPFISGESLRTALRRDGTFDTDRAVAIARQVAGALDYAHRQRIVHRDIKPENILLHEGEAMVADFGIAVAVNAAADGRLTATGVSLGSPAYMSPEQIFGERALDGRTDIYALACILYEMLAGEAPFAAPTLQAMASRRLTEPAPHISAVRPSIAPGIDEAVHRALERDPEARFPTAADFAHALGSVSATAASSDLGSLARLAKRPAVLLPAVVGVAGILALVLLPARARSARDAARASLPRIAALAAADRFPEAFTLGARAEGTIGGDSTLTRLMGLVSDRITVRSEPPGARVLLQRFAPNADGTFPQPTDVGTTPLTGLRVPRGDYRVMLRKNGFAPSERLASTARERAEAYVGTPDTVTVAVTMHAAAQAPDGMVFVPGGDYTITNPDLPTGLKAHLDDYWIDRTEVTNEQFKAFVRKGGYAATSSWPDSLTKSPAARSVAASYVDRTGMPGPREWVGQEFAAGTATHPVTGVSWYEAAAYCASVGKALPAVYQWDKAARNGSATPVEGVMMPWGFVGAHETPEFRADLGGTGTVPVDAYPFGMSPYGAYGMAGNAKEWLRNSIGDAKAVTGGSWEDPMYLYSEAAGLSPEKASRSLGFRCVRLAGPSTGDQGAGRVSIEQRTPSYTPVDRRTFETLLTHYRYDRRPLAPRVIETQDGADWTRLKVRYNGVGGDSVLAYLYLPKHASPPFETMVLLPSSALYFGQKASTEAEWLLGPAITAGRALMIIVLKGMTEREWGAGHVRPSPASVGYRDEMVLRATEMRLGLDYLATRPDIDTTKLAYVGLSLSAGSALPMAAVDDRFRSVILIGAGIDERLQPTLPEASNINFAPYIRPPKLMLNGRNDEEHPYYTRALPLWNLLRPPKKLVLVDGAGHTPPLEARIPAVNAWLDSTLGPVRR